MTGSLDPLAMREVMGHFASGVTVVTAVTDTGPIGFTCQSFSSLSLEPPLVVFAPGATPDLAAAARHRPVLHQRAGRGPGRRVAELRAVRRGQVRRRELAAERARSPVLDDVVAWIDAELWAEYDGGDHTLAVARVLDLGADPRRRPLLYHRGAYGLLQEPG
jgi:flavin reductase (DIM6/NTAB) family NADH-FMN oxidoreductase RutF